MRVSRIALLLMILCSGALLAKEHHSKPAPADLLGNIPAKLRQYEVILEPDQDEAEWVVVLAGSDGLLFEGEAEPRILKPGDYVHIPAHARHRVAWTDAGRPTVWLAVHHR